MQECVDAVLDVLEEAGFSPVPAMANMSPTPDNGVFYKAWWEKEVRMPNLAEKGVLGLDFTVFDQELEAGVAGARSIRQALQQGFGLRLLECRITGFYEGDTAQVVLRALVAF